MPRVPSIYAFQTAGRTPVITQSPSTYQHRSPFTYQHRSPSTYARQGRTPVIRWDGALSQQWPGTPITG